MSYKLLGNYIRIISNKNKGIITKDLRGVSMKKEFRKSTSNIVGTDLSKYKLVYKNQFCCDFMSVIRVHKLPVVLHVEDDPVIVSPAYIVFEINDINKLNPEYLMMWFRRSEFDRYADFRCDSAIRGGFKWGELCEVELPIPSIEKQNEIVKEYNIVVNRIKLNEQLNKKLEETAQAIYKHWFVDFEFPNEDGKPYKSSGGKMFYNEELEKDIPEGWGAGNFGKLIEPINGYAFKSDDFTEEGDFAIIKIKNVIPPNIVINDAQYFNGVLADKLKRVSISKNDILITMTGSGANQMNSAVGQVGKYYGEDIVLLNQRVCKLEPNYQYLRDYIYQFISNSETHLELLNGSSGSANQANISPKQLKDLQLVIPNEKVLKSYQKHADVIDGSKRVHSQGNLNRMKDLLLSKMSKVELEKEVEV